MAKDIENFIKQIEAPKISFLGKSNFSNSYEMWTVWSEGLFGCLSFYACAIQFQAQDPPPKSQIRDLR